MKSGFVRLGTLGAPLLGIAAAPTSIGVAAQCDCAQLGVSEVAGATYTSAQATRGQAIYEANCAECHGKNLDDGEFALPLKGEYFAGQWGGKNLNVVFDYMSTKMPPTNPGGLPLTSYADVLAYVLSQNGVPANADKELPAEHEALAGMPLKLG